MKTHRNGETHLLLYWVEQREATMSGKLKEDSNYFNKVCLF